MTTTYVLPKRGRHDYYLCLADKREISTTTYISPTRERYNYYLRFTERERYNYYIGLADQVETKLLFMFCRQWGNITMTCFTNKGDTATNYGSPTRERHNYYLCFADKGET